MKLTDRFKKVDKATIIRSVLLILAIANQIVAIIGQTSFASEKWYQIASIVVTAVTSIVAAWWNNDWTYFARLGTGVLDALQDGKITVEEVEKLLGEAECKTGKTTLYKLSPEEIDQLIDQVDSDQIEIEEQSQEEGDQ